MWLKPISGPPYNPETCLARVERIINEPLYLEGATVVWLQSITDGNNCATEEDSGASAKH